MPVRNFSQHKRYKVVWGNSAQTTFFKVQKKEEKLEIQIESNSSAWYNML